MKVHNQFLIDLEIPLREMADLAMRSGWPRIGRVRIIRNWQISLINFSNTRQEQKYVGPSPACARRARAEDSPIFHTICEPPMPEPSPANFGDALPRPAGF